MQKILIPTDFSPVADNALKSAIEIAGKFNSELFLFHIYKIHRVDYDDRFSLKDQPYKRKIEEKMNLTKQRFNDRIKEKGLKIHTHVEEGYVSSLFKEKVRQHDIDLIVLGSTGASGSGTVIFGSVAQSALDLSEVPVVVIPPEQSLAPLEQIVIAVELKKVASSVLSPIHELAMKFKAKVTFLYVNTSKTSDTKKIIDLPFKDIETSYQEVQKSGSINQSISDFIEKEKCDLLCMIRQERGFFKSLFRHSITRSQAYKNSVPLLVLPEK